METLLIPIFMLLCLAGAIILFSLTLYAIPVRFAVAFRHGTGLDENGILASWGPVGVGTASAGGILKTSVLLAGRNVYSREDHDQEGKVVTRPASPGPHQTADQIIRQFLPVMQPAGKLVIAIWQQSRLDGITGKIRIGLADPASTGMLYGGYWASKFAMNACRIYVELEPVFLQEVLDVDIMLRVRIRHPLVIVLRGVELVKDPVVRKTSGRSGPTPVGAES